MKPPDSIEDRCAVRGRPVYTARPMRALARPLAAISVSTLFVACVEILSLQGEPQDVAASFCKCEDALWVDENGEELNCADYVSQALEQSDAATTRAWLDLFGSAHCEQCKNTDVCAAEAPICREERP